MKQPISAHSTDKAQQSPPTCLLPAGSVLNIRGALKQHTYLADEICFVCPHTKLP